MAEALPCDFDVWLKDTLVALNTDDEVFSPYIKGILEGDESQEEKAEALQGIISEITDKGIDTLCDDIFAKWKALNEKPAEDTTKETLDLEEKIAKIMTEQAQIVVTNKPKPKENNQDNSLKNAILAQYGEVSDGEESDDDEEQESGGGAAFGVRNINTAEVMRAEREKREKNKEESQRKKEKDKEDRAKQKARDDERKEKEKKRTQKGERRR